jgi:hypothetical protein
MRILAALALIALPSCDPGWSLGGFAHSETGAPIPGATAETVCPTNQAPLPKTTAGLAVDVRATLATTPPSGARTPPPVKCTVTLPSSTFVAGFDYSTMTGTVTADGAAGTRRFNVRATPYSATYPLVFLGYGPGDQKPTSESMTKMTSVVGRLVSYGDVLHLFLDGDYRPSVRAPTDGFVCQ